jgi:hypothetical protein
MLRENILDSKKLGRATHAACNLWFRLLVKVDDFGNFPDDAVLIRTTCFQWRRKMRTSHVTEWINELVGIGLVSRYVANEEHFLHFERFDDFQQMRYEKVARFPRLEIPTGAPANLPQRLCDAHIAATGDGQSPTAAMTTPHRSLSLMPSTKQGVKLSKRSEVEGSAAADSLNPWKILGSDLPMGSPKFQAIFGHYFATRNGNPLSEAMERAIQRANKDAVKVPPQFFEAKRTVERRESEEFAGHAETERPELEELPWVKR